MTSTQSPIRGARYVHTNLVASDWRSLADFYRRVFGCPPVPPERDYSGRDLERGTAIRGARCAGVHLRLPGYGDDGPTLEIYSYTPSIESDEDPVNRPGFGHVAFAVASVPEARERMLAEGGSAVGEIVTLQTSTGTSVTWCYVRDPEGNVVELQSWA